jgi:hypothetical protein
MGTANQGNMRAERFSREALPRFSERLSPDHASTAITQVRPGYVLVLERRYGVRGRPAPRRICRKRAAKSALFRAPDHLARPCARI